MEGALEGVQADLDTGQGHLEMLEGGVEPGSPVGAAGLGHGVAVVEHDGPHVGLDAGYAAHIPLAADQHGDEVALGGRGGAVFGLVFGGEGVELGGIFAGDQEGLGVEAGLEAVYAGVGLAGLGAGAGGKLRVAPVGGDLSFGGHKTPGIRDRGSGIRVAGIAARLSLPCGLEHTGGLESEIQGREEVEREGNIFLRRA